MTQEEYIKKNFNEIANLTAVCKSNSSWFDDDFPELEIGKTYHVSHIGVRRSESLIMYHSASPKVRTSLWYSFH